MPAKDIYHDCVKIALIKDGWTVTHDPLSLKIGKKDIFIDLAAHKLLAAEKQGQKIAVEIKSFLGTSEIEDVFTQLFSQEIGQILLADNSLNLIIFNPEQEVITQWIN